MKRRGFIQAAGGAALAAGWLPLPRARGATGSPLFEGCELLGRPTDTSVTVNMLPVAEVEVYFEFGTAPGVYTGQTIPGATPANTPLEEVIGGLQPNTRYYYRTRYRETGQAAYAAGPEYSFHTQRAPGENFVCTITADPHPNDNSDPDMYELTLGNAAGDRPDLHFDLGDTFMTDKLPKPFQQADIDAAVRNHRPWHEILGRCAPIFLGLGNHEGEAGWLHDLGTSSTDNIGGWSLGARKRHYPNPVPDGFYGGNSQGDPHLGFLENYYAFHWGDVLFMMLDPYWYTADKPSRTGNDEWDWSLGIDQYQWMKATLEASTARYKVVFIHHLLGGNPALALLDPPVSPLIGRGGIEAAPYGEWGGLSFDGSTGWSANRPSADGWDQPIHDILLANNVSAVIHGHDHAYVKQELDGIIYQEMPQPANLNINGTNSATTGGYTSGTILPNSGYVRLSVAPAGMTVEYVRTYLPSQENASRTNGDIGDSYVITPGPGPVTGFRVSESGGHALVEWDAEPGVDYIVRWSAEMQSWTDVPVGQAGSWLDPDPIAGKRFYRVGR